MVVPYAYGCTVRVWLYRTRIRYPRIRIWYVPYAYGTKYAYGIDHKDFYVVYQLEMVAGEVESSCKWL